MTENINLYTLSRYRQLAASLALLISIGLNFLLIFKDFRNRLLSPLVCYSFANYLQEIRTSSAWSSSRRLRRALTDGMKAWGIYINRMLAADVEHAKGGPKYRKAFMIEFF
jgi:hypothetical protein